MDRWMADWLAGRMDGWQERTERLHLLLKREKAKKARKAKKAKEEEDEDEELKIEARVKPCGWVRVRVWVRAGAGVRVEGDV